MTIPNHIGIASWQPGWWSTKTEAWVVTLVVVGLTVLGWIVDLGEGESTRTAVALAVAMVAAASTWFRRKDPIAVLLVIAAARIFLTWNTGNEHALLPAALVALFTVARYAERRRGLTIAASAGLAMAFGIAVFDGEQFFPEFFSEIAFMAVPIAIGDAVRSRADRLKDLIETEANNRVQAERIRIARDLHDVVAHGLSTIAIQSGVAAHLLDRDTAAAKEALEVINTTGKKSLEELRAMVGVLRSTDEVPLSPTPTNPDDLTDLLAGAANAGIEVKVETSGSFPAHVGDSCVVAMHRIIQEALTNVARHSGAADTTLRIDHSSDHAEVSIRNRQGLAEAAAIESTGVGIIGMRERAESLGGTLTVGPTNDGGFQVVAVLPYNFTDSLARERS